MESPAITTISTTQEYDEVVKRMRALEQLPNAETNQELQMLAEAVATYDDAYTPEPALPQTLQGILELEMYKRRIKQRALAQLLDIHETRLSEMMRNKRPISFEFAKKLWTVLGVPAETVLSLPILQAA